MGERCFRQEYMCQFEDAVSTVFDTGLVRQAITDEMQPLRLRAGTQNAGRTTFVPSVIGIVRFGAAGVGSLFEGNQRHSREKAGG